MSNQAWFSARTVYRHDRIEAGIRKALFEERVILIQAANFDDAIAQAESEAEEYCYRAGEVSFLGFVDAYRVSDPTVGNKTEVFSLMRESTLSDQNYLDTFFDTGTERRAKQE